MAGLWVRVGRIFKSPLRTQVKFLRRSRDLKREKLEASVAECERLRRALAIGERVASLAGRDRLQVELEAIEKSRRPHAAPALTFVDPPIGTHGYGERTVHLAVQLVQAGVGLRAVERVLKVVFEAVNLTAKVPHWTTIRGWLQRLGLDALKPLAKADDWVWLVDHAIQTGPDKVMVARAVRAKHMPPPGQALRQADVQTIAIVSKAHWNQDIVYEELKKLVAIHGCPRAIVNDHGAELLGGIGLLKHDYPNIVGLYDLKHKAACLFKAIVNKDERFADFQTRIGRTRAAIQQTEMSFLAPPSPKSKARFMNLGPPLAWAVKIRRLLDCERFKARKFVAKNRLEERLGWLRAFDGDIAGWMDCQAVVNVAVTFVNEQGIFQGAARKLRAALTVPKGGSKSETLAEDLVAFVDREQSQLKKGERLPFSTEILESSFAKYKHLEGQHSKQGFTGLILAFAALLKTYTPKSIADAMKRVSVADVKKWVGDNLGVTHAAKRTIAYNDAKLEKAATICLNAA